MPADSGPRATDALANERTFLAWLRTALALAGFGFVIARFSLFTREFSVITHHPISGGGPSGTAIGAAMAVAALATSAYGSFRYVSTARALRANRVETLPDYAAIVGGAFVALVAVVLAVDLIAIH